MRTVVWLLAAALAVLALGCGECGDDKTCGTSVPDDADDTKSTDETKDSDSDDVVDAGIEEAPWPIPPTGQTACYDTKSKIDCPAFPCDPSTEFCGQDGQYRDHSRQFIESTVGSDAIVTDSLTGLIWQRGYTPDTGWHDAVDTCENLTYAGQSDWRLPDMHELAGLINYGRFDPASSFPDMPSAFFWSSNEDLTDYDGMAWLVGFIFGMVRQGLDHDDLRPFKCVRGEQAEITGSDRFVVSGEAGEKIVLDKATGIYWQKRLDNRNSRKTWKQALAYCEKLDYGGYNDWRLPNVQEMRVLINLAKTGPSSDFPGLPGDYFWTSTSSHYEGYEDTAWCLHYPLGSVLYTHKSLQTILSLYGMAAKCVRGGP